MKILGLIHYYSKYLYFLVFGRDTSKYLRSLQKEKRYTVTYARRVFFQWFLYLPLSKSYRQVLLHNNTWGDYKLDQKAYSQALLSNIKVPEAPENIEVGWAFEPPLNMKGVLGYPSIVVGGSGWGILTETEEFPVKISDLRKLEVEYRAELYTDNLKHNLAFDLWIVDRETGERLCEIMIWEDYQVARPYGKKRGIVDGYVVTSGYLDKSHEPNDETGWDFLALRRIKRRQGGTVDILSLLKGAADLGAIKREYFDQDLMGIEFGTEVYSSSGVCIVKCMELNYEK